MAEQEQQTPFETTNTSKEGEPLPSTKPPPTKKVVRVLTETTEGKQVLYQYDFQVINQYN